MWAGYAIFFSRLSITNHHALNTRAISLGIYDNIFYQSAHGRPLGCTFMKAGYHGSAHFDPALLLVAPLYLAYPHAELILAALAFHAGIQLMARPDLLGFEMAALLICFLPGVRAGSTSS